MRSASDVWICSRCRSVNSLGRDRCYKCSTPIEVAAARPEDLSIVHEKTPDVPTGTFHSSETFAVAVSILSVAFIFATLFVLWTNLTAVDMILAGDHDGANTLISDRVPFTFLAIGLGFLALVAFGAWIRQVVANVPTLGLGYSKVSPTFAFFEPLIPGFNLYAIPSRMGEMITKLGPHPTALPLLGLAIVLVVGTAAVYLLLFRFTRILSAFGERSDVLAIALLVGFAVEAVAIVIANVVVWQIEGMARNRHEALSAPRPARRSV